MPVHARGRDNGRRHGQSRLAAATSTLRSGRTETKEALRGLGWSAAVAQAAAAAAASMLSPDAPLEPWIREALQRCPRPVAAQEPSSA